jgi:hypothetical protein
MSGMHSVSGATHLRIFSALLLVVEAVSAVVPTPSPFSRVEVGAAGRHKSSTDGLNAAEDSRRAHSELAGPPRVRATAHDSVDRQMDSKNLLRGTTSGKGSDFSSGLRPDSGYHEQRELRLVHQSIRPKVITHKRHDFPGLVLIAHHDWPVMPKIRNLERFLNFRGITVDLRPLHAITQYLRSCTEA